MREIKAIETRYKGYRFRSRLEARWAVFFDALGIKWEYEKEGYDLGDGGWYLPDFWLSPAAHLKNGEGVWLEIKGIEPTQEELSKLAALAYTTNSIAHLVCGLPGDTLPYMAHPGFGLWQASPPQPPSEALFGILCRLGGAYRIWTGFSQAIEAARSARFEHGESGAA